MKTEKEDDILRLIANYLAGSATEAEVVFLETWIKSSHLNQKYYLQIKNIWEASDKQFNPMDISPKDDLKKVLRQISTKTPQSGIWFYWQKIAAILFIPLLAGTLLWRPITKSNESQSGVVYNEVYASFGTRSALKLADGSLVWLNSGSSLKYPDKFIGNKRVVYLKGEAYFEVKSDVSKPFLVQTQSLYVKATGTKFNVQAFGNDHIAEVTLESGKVSVSKTGKNDQNALISVLKPNQHLVFDTITGNTMLNEEDIYKYIAWKDGKLIFRNQPLSEVVKKISQIYQVDIELRGKQLQDYRYRATFEEESLVEILKLLKLSSPIDYKEIKRDPLPDGSFPKKRIIIFPQKNT